MKQTIKKLLPKLYYSLYKLKNINKPAEPNDDYIMLPKKELTYSNDLLYTFHNADFIKDPKFDHAYKLCKELGGNLLKDYDIQWRVYILCCAAHQATKLEGDFIDCGVYTGFCTRAIIDFVNFEKLNKKYYLMDTFEGLDAKYSNEYEMKRNDKLGYGKSGNLYDTVKNTFKEFKNVELVKGSIPETLPLVKTEKISFLSIDMNTEVPEIAAMEYFWDKMVSGAIIVLDDYGYPGCENQKAAHDKFAASKGLLVFPLPTCQGLIIKP
ncbi:MAG: class I SAM-dependent methyltransferase [Sphingobacteriaceae bacterium]|nr:class I SAM-dependent methyltransferase [Sphingobacteriaceae bacterium]